MGCIHSKKDLSELNPNIYRVTNVNADGVALWSGHLEISPRELTLYRKGKEPTKWSLQHLRRYGFDADLFTFEAGRRCTTGEGIYAFKCRGAESLFHTLRSYIEGIALNDDGVLHSSSEFHSGGGGGSNSNSMVNSQARMSVGRQISLNFRSNHNFPLSSAQNNSTNYIISSNRSSALNPNGTIILGNSNGSRSIDDLPNESNYLEPTPMRNNIGIRYSSGARLGSISSGGPLSPEPNSPGSPNSFHQLWLLDSYQQSQQQQQQHYQNSNVYQEFPVRSRENNNNLLSKKLSLDIPPQEPAPAPNTQPNNVSNSNNNNNNNNNNNDNNLMSSGETLTTAANALTNNVASTAAIMNTSASSVASGSCGSPLQCQISSPVKTLHQDDPDGDALHMYVNITPGDMEGLCTANSSSTSTTASQGTMSVTTGSAATTATTVGTPTNTNPINFSQQLSRLSSNYSIDPTTRCYENLGPADVRPLLTRNRYSKPDIFAKVDLPNIAQQHSMSTSNDRSEPPTPVYKQQHSQQQQQYQNKEINYLVLDLDQSPSSSSTVAGNVTGPNVTNNETKNSVNNNNNNNNSSSNNNGNNLNASGDAGITTTTSVTSATGISFTLLTKSASYSSNGTTNCGPGPNRNFVCKSNSSNLKATTPTSRGNLLPPESPKKSSLGYATIDFDKTVALSNSTAPSSDIDNEGSRKTRHSSTVVAVPRQNNSISD